MGIKYSLDPNSYRTECGYIYFFIKNSHNNVNNYKYLLDHYNFFIKSTSRAIKDKKSKFSNDQKEIIKILSKQKVLTINDVINNKIFIKKLYKSFNLSNSHNYKEDHIIPTLYN